MCPAAPDLPIEQGENPPYPARKYATMQGSGWRRHRDSDNLIFVRDWADGATPPFITAPLARDPRDPNQAGASCFPAKVRESRRQRRMRADVLVPGCQGACPAGAGRESLAFEPTASGSLARSAHAPKGWLESKR